MTSEERPTVVQARQLPRWVHRLVNALTLGLLNSHNELQVRFQSLESNLVSSEQRERALVERLDSFAQQAVRDRVEIQTLHAQFSGHATTRMEACESRLDRAEWGREAMVERANFSDAREELLALRVTELESRIVELRAETARMTALAWDSIAIARRLGVLEDRTETLMERLESENGPQALVTYPVGTKAAG